MITAHHLVFGRNIDFSDFLYSEINSIVSYLPITKNGTVTYTTDRKGGNTAIQFGSGNLQTANNLPASAIWSFSFWIKTTETLTRVIFAVNGVTTGNREWVILIEGGKIRAAINNANQTYLNVGNAPTIVNDNIWHHIVVTLDSTQSSSNEIKIWIDSAAQNLTKSYNTDTSGSFINKGLIIGKVPTNSNYFTGIVDDLKIYNRQQTQTEITNLYNE